MLFGLKLTWQTRALSGERCEAELIVLQVTSRVHKIKLLQMKKMRLED